jgi:hypothetical protein
MTLKDEKTPSGYQRWAIIVIGSIGVIVGVWIGSISQVAAQRGAEPGAVVFENDKVVVRQYLLHPGMSTGTHSHGHDYLRVILQGGMVEITALNGSTQTEKLEAGTVVWRTKTTHSTKNIGGNPIEGLVIEIK